MTAHGDCLRIRSVIFSTRSLKMDRINVSSSQRLAIQRSLWLAVTLICCCVAVDLQADSAEHPDDAASSMVSQHSLAHHDTITVRWQLAVHPEELRIRLYRLELGGPGDQPADTLLSEEVVGHGTSSSQLQDIGAHGLTWAYQLRYVTPDGQEHVLHTARCAERQASGSSPATRSAQHQDHGLTTIDDLSRVALTTTLMGEDPGVTNDWRPRPPVPPPRSI